MPIKTLTLILALALSPFVAAETLKLKLGEQGSELQAELPKRGMSIEDVVEKYGEPESKTEARGEPPISAWHYAEFAVYFENQHVLHSVIKHKPKLEK